MIRRRPLSAAQVRDRLRRSAQARLDRLRVATERLPGSALPDPLEPAPVPFFFDPARAEEMRATWSRDHPEDLAQLRAEADELLAGRTAVLGRPIRWTDTPDWHTDPITGHEWPQSFWSTIAVRDGEARCVWRLARHQHLMTLARAAFLTGETAYAAAASRWLKSWIDCNPPYIGIHWTSARELALRLIAWSWIYRLLQAPGLWRHAPELEREFFRLVQLQAEYILRYHSDDASGDNHLVAEAAGVATAGLTFPWLAEADRWRDWGLAALARELPRQVYPDGVVAAQSFERHAFLMDLALQPVLLGRHQARETPVELLERLELMAEFLHAVMDASGGVPPVGEAGDGTAIVLGPDAGDRHRSLLATSGVLFHRPDFCRAAGHFDAGAAWLLGRASRERFEALCSRSSGVRATRQSGLPDDPPLHPVSRSFPHGGYSVIRSGEGAEEQLILLNHGPVGRPAVPAAGHTDCLSLVMHLGGRPVLVDRGSASPHEQPVWQQYFRGTPAHNTVTVDGKRQSETTGPDSWGRGACGRLLGWTSQAEFDFVEAEHDGYQHLVGRPLHRRSLFHRRGGATFVVDRVLGDGTHGVELTWHLPTGTALAPDGAGTWLADGDGLHLQLTLLSDATAETEVVAGQEQPPQGWAMAQSGTREPAPVLRSYQRGPLPLAWVTVLLPQAVGEQRAAAEGHSDMGLSTAAIGGRIDARGVVVTLDQPGHREIYIQSFGAETGRPGTPRQRGPVVGGQAAGAANQGEPPLQASDGWLDLGHGRFRGRAAHLRFDGVGRLVELRATAALELEWAGHVVWRAAVPEDVHVVLTEPAAGVGR